MIKNKFKLVSIGQIENAFQIAIDRIQYGKSAYFKEDVLAIIKVMYELILNQGTQNAKAGLYLPDNEEELQ